MSAGSLSMWGAGLKRLSMFCFLVVVMGVEGAPVTLRSDESPFASEPIVLICEHLICDGNGIIAVLLQNKSLNE